MSQRKRYSAEFNAAVSSSGGSDSGELELGVVPSADADGGVRGYGLVPGSQGNGQAQANIELAHYTLPGLNNGL